MESASSPPSPPPPPADTAEDRKQEAAPAEDETMHKIKVIQFLGRNTPIILQNNNGPCPLLAICNVLLLKNCLSASLDVPEVSQETLLSLVAERLIDSNSNTENKDAVYVENQQQNIANAIDLLPRLTTGIDVNIKFQRIDNFEFTQECAIFDLLDIPLYHGWIVDPQDRETANAIGSKSYNTLMGELVALEAQSMKNEPPMNPEEDDVDFAAATTATLGVPSPTISIGTTFDDSCLTVPDESYPVSLVESHIVRKGDIEEDAELVRALKLSETELVTPPVDDVSTDKAHLSKISKESTSRENSEMESSAEPVEGNCASGVASNSGAANCETGNDGITEILPGKLVCSEKLDLHDHQSQSTSTEPIIIAEEPDLFFQANLNSTFVEPKEKLIATSESYEQIPKFDIVQSQSTNISETGDLGTKPDDIDTLGSLGSCLTGTTDSKESNYLDKPQALASDIDSSEPIYEGEDCILDSKTESCQNLEPVYEGEEDCVLASKTESCQNQEPVYEGEEDCVLDSKAKSCQNQEPVYEGEEDCVIDSKTESCQNQEPVYEGEVILAEQVDNMVSLSETKPRSEMTVKEGEIVVNFLRSNASQLTVNGLFCLQEGINERELCVFFRNNHFNTMFKFKGQLYILVTDQGYINQPDLVWEKLNEVNGDTLYMTGDFKEFKVDDHSNSAWDEQNAISSTADYLASIDISAQQQSNVDSDHQLAVALQEKEFEQQQQPQRNSDIQQHITPQAPRNIRRRPPSSSNSKPEPKPSKEKCTLM